MKKVRVFTITLMLILAGVVSCVTQKGVTKYANKYPERMNNIAWDYMDKNKDKASAYCSTRFPSVSTGSSVEVIIDTAAMTELAAQAVSDALLANDSAWYETLDSSFVSKELVIKRIQLLQEQYQRRIDYAVRKALLQCDLAKRVIIRDTVQDMARLVACELRYTKLDREYTDLKKSYDKLIVELDTANGSKKQWAQRAIATWIILAILLALFTIYKIKIKRIGLG